MKPNFALSLSFDGIRLLHRAAGGWRIVGDVESDTGDLAGEMSTLRRTAAAIEPAGVRCKLLVPNEQIRYLTIETPGLDEAGRHAAARKALDGATPYAVNDLVYDISPDGEQTHVAAVARETLDEAEGFAETHHFNPLCLAAVPGDQAFLGEPWFGPARNAARLLEEGDTVERDGVAVVVIGEMEIPAGPVVSDDSLDLSAQDAADPEEAESEVEVDAFAPSEDADPEDETQDPDPVQDASDVPDEADEPIPPPVFRPLPDSFIETADQSFAEAPAPPLVARPEPGAAPTVGFASRRGPRAQPAFADPQFDVPSPARPPQAVSGARAEPLLASGSARVNGARLDIPEPKFRKAAKPARTGGPRMAPSPAPAPGTDASAASIPVVGRDDPHARTTNRGKSLDFEAPAPALARGRPRHLGLILTVILLLALAAVGAWASIEFKAVALRFFDKDQAQPFEQVQDDRTAALATLTDAELPAELVEPAKRDLRAELPENAGVVTASIETTLSDEDAAVLDALRRPQPTETDAARPDETATVDPEQTGDEIEAGYAVSGIWPLPPDLPRASDPIPVEDVYVAGIDPVSLVQDAVALPDVAGQDTDLALAAPNAPAAAGTDFRFDDRGLVVPTPEGVVTPDGVQVYLGQPPLVPPDVMTRSEPAAEQAPQTAALGGARPRLRPSTLIETNERANNDGLTRNELAALRPELRPRSAQEEALAAASLVPLDGEPEARETPDLFATATKYAATSSRRPDGRPGDFATVVARAQEAQTRSAAPVRTEVAAAVQAAPAPVVQRSAPPSIPSSATVSRSATVKNAINLRDVNLIGVYGRPKDRRALIRLSNGRYQKVKVGDRIDGGRISAIGDSELYYQKGGRNVVLRMPQT